MFYSILSHMMGKWEGVASDFLQVFHGCRRFTTPLAPLVLEEGVLSAVLIEIHIKNQPGVLASAWKKIVAMPGHNHSFVRRFHHHGIPGRNEIASLQFFHRTEDKRMPEQ